MSVPAFDTLKFVRTLRDAGIDPKQAEATAEAFAAAVSQELATKTDVREAEQRTTTSIAAVRTDILELGHRIDALSAETKARFDQVDSKLREMELRMTIKLGALIVGTLTVLFGLAMFVLRILPMVGPA